MVCPRASRRTRLHRRGLGAALQAKRTGGGAGGGGNVAQFMARPMAFLRAENAPGGPDERGIFDGPGGRDDDGLSGITADGQEDQGKGHGDEAGGNGDDQVGAVGAVDGVGFEQGDDEGGGDGGDGEHDEREEDDGKEGAKEAPVGDVEGEDVAGGDGGDFGAGRRGEDVALVPGDRGDVDDGDGGGG